MTEPNLLPCPWCNSAPVVDDDLARCPECGIGWEVERWNQRTPAPLTPAQKLEAVREFMERCLSDTSDKSFLEVAEIALAEMEGGVH